MPVGNLGLVFPWKVSNAIGEDLTEVATQWRWVNRNPFFTRLAAYPCDQIEFTAEGSNNRPDTVRVTVAALATDTTLTLADVTYLMNGDTLELTFANSTVEVMEVIADPNETASQVTVKRGDAFTTAGAIPINTDLRIIGNSRTGGEKWQKAIGPTHWRRANWIQTYQHPVEIAGVLQDTRSYRTRTIAPGSATPLDAYRMRALSNEIDDIERSIVYQRGMAPTDSNTKRAKTKGVRQQCQDSGSYIYQPTNYAAYKPADFARDLAQGPAGNGGSPNLFFVSNDWLGGLATWKMPMAMIDMGTTAFDIRIEAFRSDVSPGAVFVRAPRLKAGTIFACNGDDVFLRYMRMPFWKPRGNSGDTEEGDIISRLGVQMNNPDQQRFIEGITGFAPA